MTIPAKTIHSCLAFVLLTLAVKSYPLNWPPWGFFIVMGVWCISCIITMRYLFKLRKQINNWIDDKGEGGAE